MPRHVELAARRVPLVALIGASAALVLALVAAVLVVPSGDRASEQESEIRALIESSAVELEIEQVSRLDGGGEPRFAVGLRLIDEPDADAAGELLAALFDETYAVASVDLRFTDGPSLHAAEMERTHREWAELVDYAAGLRACELTVAQVGPTGMAVYRLGVAAQVDDPMTAYEELLADERPEWVSLGQVSIATPSGHWPKHTIDVGRELTPDERDHFRGLDRELASTVGGGERYLIRVTASLGDEQAEFVSRVVPAVPASVLDPTAPADRDRDRDRDRDPKHGDAPTAPEPGADPGTDPGTDGAAPAPASPSGPTGGGADAGGSGAPAGDGDSAGGADGGAAPAPEDPGTGGSTPVDEGRGDDDDDQGEDGDTATPQTRPNPDGPVRPDTGPGDRPNPNSTAPNPNSAKPRTIVGDSAALD